MAQKKYEADCKEFISKLMSFLEKKPYANRIVGWHPLVCTENDSFIGGIRRNRSQTDRSKISIGDFHPGAIAAYQNWLRKKYHGSLDDLRKAWGDKHITFETAKPVISELVEAGAQGGMFRNPLKSPAAYDYFEFFPSLLGSFKRRLAKFFKEKTDGKALVLMHYGTITATLKNCEPIGTRQHTNNNDFLEMLKDPNIDVYVSAPLYESRHAGQPYFTYIPVDSVTLHGRMYAGDNDERTFSAGTLRHGRHRGVKETCAVMMRDIGWYMVKNCGAWFADMSYGRPRKWDAMRYPWFSREETTTPMRQMFDIFTEGLKKKHASGSEIAVFVSASTPRYEDIYRAPPLYYNLISKMLFRDMNMIGAPYDIYLMSDLANPKIKKDYKLYIFLNPFFMTPQERIAVQKLKGKGKTLLWFYAPGYVDRERGLITEGISEVTGIKISKKDKRRELLRFKMSDRRHPIIKNVGGKGSIAKGYRDEFWEPLHPEILGPVFYVDDPRAISLGTYPDGKTALALRQFDEWNSIYSAVPVLDTNVLRNVADFAGVHIYCDEDVVLAADNRLLMVNNGYEQNRNLKIKLPERRKIIDALTGEVLSENKKTFMLKLQKSQTRILKME